MGSIDRMLRIITVILITILYYTEEINGMLASVLSLISMLFIVTSFISHCPLYLPFGINTNQKRQ